MLKNSAGMRRALPLRAIMPSDRYPVTMTGNQSSTPLGYPAMVESSPDKIIVPPEVVSVPLVSGRWNRPGLVVLLWVCAILLHGIEQVLFAESYFSSSLFFASVPVFAALVGVMIAGLRKSWFALAAGLLAVDCAVMIFQLALQSLFGATVWTFAWGLSLVAAVLVSARLTALAGLRAGVAPSTVGRAAIAVMMIVGVAPLAPQLDEPIYALTATLESVSDHPSVPVIDSEALWTAQPSLVKQSVNAVEPLRSTGQDTFLVTIGAGGSQDLFGREARTARTVLGQAFGASQRSILLANDKASLNRIPLATNSNLDAALAGIASKMAGSSALVVLYLTSHGSRDAELTTNLPDYQSLPSIGATRLAQSLNRAGIRRRVIIVSACYAGSWIKPLASDDTIVIAAARADRTSFGCSDDRQLTYFGEAILTGKLKDGASLAVAFDSARRQVASWEGREAQLPSLPQAFVGRNMTGIWNAPNTASPQTPIPPSR